MADIDTLRKADQRGTLSGVPDGFDALILADLARQAAARPNGLPILHICREEERLAALAGQIRFFAGDIDIVTLPAWDCLPYDRVSPNTHVLARRMAALTCLAAPKKNGPRIVITTVSAALQRLPSRDFVTAQYFHASPGDHIDIPALLAFLTHNGYSRASKVTEPGEFAQRGGLIDIFPPDAKEPLRLDLFGDELDQLRRFDPMTQRTTGKAKHLTLRAVAEFALDDESIRRFRQGYVATFGGNNEDDPLYQTISEGRRYQGAEHWLPLFHDRMETVFSYMPDAFITLDHQADDVAIKRLESICDYYEIRKEQAETQVIQTALSSPYKPLEPRLLYLDQTEWTLALKDNRAQTFSPFNAPEDTHSLSFNGRLGRDFAPERQARDSNVYDAVRMHITSLLKAGKRVLIATYSDGARQRLQSVLADHTMTATAPIDSWDKVHSLPPHVIGLPVMALEHGFETPDLAIITEQDILGDRLIRRGRKARRADDFLRDISVLSAGDLVVHVDHGIGRFERLETIDVSGAPHDCVVLCYRGGDRLYIPVENIDMLSRYGSDAMGTELDKLGSHSWQAKKARMKTRIRDMAEELIKIAATRAMRKADTLTTPAGLYDEFSARFPYVETDDQLNAIKDVIDDLGSGKPMDRLVCGDVGFGKTEVGLRAAFLAVMAGYQVAMVAPTTLLARQHYQTFIERFRDLPVQIAQLSRLVATKAAKTVKDGLRDGTIDIVIGTHALLGKTISFKRLGLLIIDEEQHFGVTHKERLKQLKADVHVLTLTATPIPRTLQLAMSGIRDLSLIATPPVDRLAVRTFVMPFDQMVIREALLREHYRGGQSFYVVPRIADLDEAAAFLKSHVPEVKVITAHGQMTPARIEDTMTAFYEGRYDVLLSTTIVESGLDIPRANTLIVHRADMFGLAQLYQLRGRVGRSKTRAYAYLTHPANKALTDGAQKRLEVLQSLDTLGAGFTLASHDMDIRGAGNLLGDAQSGHIREVGVELYQHMLEEAVAKARIGDSAAEDNEPLSPQINVGATVLIPESYVSDLNLRMALYRRIAELGSAEEIEGFAAELIDRFGTLPMEVEHLLAIIRIKITSIQAGISKIDAGPKGVTVSFHRDSFTNPLGLVEFISRQKVTAKLRPDHKLVYLAREDDIPRRLKMVLKLVQGIAKVATNAKETA